PPTARGPLARIASTTSIVSISEAGAPGENGQIGGTRPFFAGRIGKVTPGRWMSARRDLVD
ncbi:MAG TPA: hypothetical protein VES88_08910, partial [Gemmatimonadaceae bacterium]|nr:hypothetical protein [Gemmatimonadaceae bacterium]